MRLWCDAKPLLPGGPSRYMRGNRGRAGFRRMMMFWLVAGALLLAAAVALGLGLRRGRAVEAPALQDQPAEDPAPLPPSGSGHILADAPEAAFPSPPLPEPAPQRAEDPPSATLAILRPAAEALAASAARLPADAELVMELTLDTEGIGPIRFIMETAGDVIRVHLVAQQADVLDLLRHHAADLIAGLQEAGYREAQMSFGAWQRPPPSPLPPTDAADTTEAAVVAPPVAMVAACRGGLDIRW